MKNILFIEVSPRRKESASRTVANTLAARLSALYPSAKLVRRDLAADHLPHLDDITLRAISTKDAGEAQRLRDAMTDKVIRHRGSRPRRSWPRSGRFPGPRSRVILTWLRPSRPGAWSAGWPRVAGCELGVNALGFGELVFQDDDAAGGLQRAALVNQLAGAGGQPQLITGVAAVPAR